MLSRVEEWWNPDHSYSGNAANLTLQPQADAVLVEQLRRLQARLADDSVVRLPQAYP